MKTRTFLAGLGGGIAIGYAAFRAYEALHELREPTPQQPADARSYGRLRRTLQLTDIVRSLAGTAAFTYGPAAPQLDRLVSKRLGPLRPAAFAALAMAVDTLIETPIAFIEEHIIERRSGLTERSASEWFTEHIKGAAVGIAISGTLAGIFGAVVRRFPGGWPYLASAGVLPLSVLANVIGPLYIMPLFNTFEPLEGPLEVRLRALASRFGVGSAEILRMDMSRQTKKANAFVTGIGTTHRIIVGDTLLEHFTDDEIEFVVAHELGHYVNHDTWRLVAAAQIAATVLLIATALTLGKPTHEEAASPQTLVRIYLWVTLFSQFARPALTAFSRSREWAADVFALEATDAPATGASAFRRLRDQNLAEDEQPGWYEFLFSTHPSLKARIAALEAAQRA